MQSSSNTPQDSAPTPTPISLVPNYSTPSPSAGGIFPQSPYNHPSLSGTTVVGTNTPHMIGAHTPQAIVAGPHIPPHDPLGMNMGMMGPPGLPGLGLGMMPGLSMPGAAPGEDVNSPELFKQNILLVRDQVTRVRDIATHAMLDLHNAYCVGGTPSQVSADLATLKQAVDILCSVMHQTGVGALPLLPLTAESETPLDQIASSEEELLTTTSQSVQSLFEQLKKKQDSAEVVANLLSQTNVTGAGRLHTA